MDFLWNFSGVKTGRRNENQDQLAAGKKAGIMPPLRSNVSRITGLRDGRRENMRHIRRYGRMVSSGDYLVPVFIRTATLRPGGPMKDSTISAALCRPFCLQLADPGFHSDGRFSRWKFLVKNPFGNLRCFEENRMATGGRYHEVRITGWSKNRRHHAAEQVIGPPGLRGLGHPAGRKMAASMPPQSSSGIRLDCGATRAVSSAATYP
jgi:hypothetical protein